MKSAPVIIVQLVHIEGPMRGRIQEFSESEVYIGRHPSCHVQFPKDMTTISRRHAKIVREGNRFKLVNQGANGTFVNGKRCDEIYLKDGDVLTITENGPKVSFLTEMKEVPGTPEVEPSPEPPARESHSAPPAVPPVRPKPADAELRPSSPEQPQMPRAPARKEPPGSVRMEQQGPPPGDDMSVQKVQVPLIIQFGPTLRSFKELPVSIGKSPKCDFMLNHPAIIDHHARVFYGRDRYWVKDLTGQEVVTINDRPVGLQAPLNPDDTLSLSASGPRFRFLGGGRLAEIEEPVREDPIQDKREHTSGENRETFSPKDQAEKLIKGAKNVLNRFLQR